MDKLTFKYPAVCIKQSDNSKPLIMFGANAIEIEKWAGIPQKKSFDVGSAETSGFQRTENTKRLKQLSSFYENEKNVVQNNLICALKNIEGGSVSFLSDNGITGEIVIEFPNLYTASFETLFSLLRTSLESRLGAIVVDKNTTAYTSLKSKLDELNDEDDFDEPVDSQNEDTEQESIIFEETHLDEFLLDVAIRHELLKELSSAFIEEHKFLGFDRQSLLAFLLPITLVDGQHRLKGATLAARNKANDEAQDLAIEKLEAGGCVDNIEEELSLKYARTLPISLLMEEDPKEQVFQFVVINQKATPIGKSLLGTIISTSLTTSEMEAVTERLQDSGIAMEDARAITWAARNPSSPFCGLVERGTQSEKKDLLQWNVMGSLIQIFKELKGGSLYHTKNDYAKRWKEKYLSESSMISSDNTKDAFEEWRTLNGTWRDFFIAFWRKVKDELAQDTNESRFNYWGNTRKSNIFNKISLTILAADFFKYLVTTKTTINHIDEISEVVDDWLEDVNRAYFDVDWDLKGVKKDSTGIRERWSENWADYRENPERLPQVKSYRSAKK
ncbi:hypothetical protein [Pseudoalteromonas ulvae]|uniref:DGQHR domain-containing protein n=1 Tax=Pseudoalteromonas ulvae TaxID=107327 RepID=A0A244CMP3_PSEDV|nr:hypothetical protein [Pseudoalteromonas ulvae]OUL56897.1 hypothetical protein B1199_16150 [Pseudoalteromonas ulvae]